MPHVVSGPRLLVALDVAEPAQALALASAFDPKLCRLKVGKELFTRAGPSLVEQLQTRGFEIFLDLKFHDIPATCAGAVRAAADLGVWMVNVHAAGGERMIAAAREALAAASRPPLLTAVTVLTSLTADDLAVSGLHRPVPDLVSDLAALAQRAGADGVVCSAEEAPRLRHERGSNFALVTPGIRPVGVARDDQQRVLTPAEALAAGSDYLVVGRPITQAPDPGAACRDLADLIAGAGA